MRRRDLLCAAGLAPLAACRRSQTGPLQTIKFGVQPFPGMSVFYLGLERGYFRDAGLDIQTEVLTSGSQVSSALASGQLDAALNSSGPGMFNLVARGGPLRIVMGREVISPVCGDAAVVYARKKVFPEGTGDIRRWIGKHFSTGNKTGLGEYFLDTILTSAGLDPKKIQRTSLSAAEAAAAITSGAIDAVLNATNLRLGLDSRPEIVRETAGATAIDQLQYSYVYFGPRLLAADPAIGASVLRAYLRASREFVTGATPQFLKDYVTSKGLNSSVLQECRSSFTPDGSIETKDLQVAIDWAVSRQYVEKGLSAESVIDRRFWDLARAKA